ncbi:MAG TPA: hypothetical protein VNA20_17840 [Frankiaceae bacterium]|nr:hypothetical protein [Frankiaceae bacterium]
MTTTATERPAAARAVLDPPSRRSAIRALAIGLVVAAAIGVTETRRIDVPLPPSTATPDEVVRAYIAAIDAGDIPTAKALVTPEHAAQVEAYEDSWYDTVISITDLRVEPPRLETPPGVTPQLMWVRVYFDMRERPRFWQKKDDQIWGYQLVRNGPDDRWLIRGEGKI